MRYSTVSHLEAEVDWPGGGVYGHRVPAAPRITLVQRHALAVAHGLTMTEFRFLRIIHNPLAVWASSRPRKRVITWTTEERGKPARCEGWQVRWMASGGGVDRAGEDRVQRVHMKAVRPPRRAREEDRARRRRRRCETVVELSRAKVSQLYGECVQASY